MTPAPTGRLVPTDSGRDLVVVRTLAVPLTDVWAGFTRPEVTGRWFATWSGEPGPGSTVRATLTGEEGAEADIHVTACDPPRHLAVSSEDGEAAWDLEVWLEDDDGGTRLTFVQHLDAETDIGSIGPGWEYYLDRLGAVLQETPEPAFEDYYPADREYYERL